jgi:hypothetical protein
MGAIEIGATSVMLSPRQMELDDLHLALVPLPSLYWAMSFTLLPLLLLA